MPRPSEKDNSDNRICETFAEIFLTKVRKHQNVNKQIHNLINTIKENEHKFYCYLDLKLVQYL